MQRSTAQAFLFGLFLLWLYYQFMPEGDDNNRSIIQLFRPARKTG